MDFGANLSAISNLMKESEEAAVKRHGHNQAPASTSVTTVVTGKQASVNLKAAQEVAAAEAAEKERKEVIWTETEVPPEDALIDEKDERISARYEFSYKQSVGTEDTYLGINDKTPASYDCTHLVVKVHFPGSTMKDLSLDVTKNRIKATSKTHKLFTYLPVSVRKDEGRAQFDSKKSVLSVTIPIIHDL
jgi:hypothetical protein